MVKQTPQNFRPQRISFFTRVGHKRGINSSRLGHNWGMVLRSGLDMGMFLRRSPFFTIVAIKINESPSRIMLTAI